MTMASTGGRQWIFNITAHKHDINKLSLFTVFPGGLSETLG